MNKFFKTIILTLTVIMNINYISASPNSNIPVHTEENRSTYEKVSLSGDYNIFQYSDKKIIKNNTYQVFNNLYLMISYYFKSKQFGLNEKEKDDYKKLYKEYSDKFNKSVLKEFDVNAKFAMKDGSKQSLMSYISVNLIVYPHLIDYANFDIVKLCKNLCKYNDILFSKEDRENLLNLYNRESRLSMDPKIDYYVARIIRDSNYRFEVSEVLSEVVETVVKNETVSE